MADKFLTHTAEQVDTAIDDINNHKANTSNPHSVTGSQVILTGYEKPSFASDIAETDTTNQAIGKVEKRVSDNETNILSKIGASDYATQNTGGTVRIWTTTSGNDTILHIANEAPTP